MRKPIRQLLLMTCVALTSTILPAHADQAQIRYSFKNSFVTPWAREALTLPFSNKALHVSLNGKATPIREVSYCVRNKDNYFSLDFFGDTQASGMPFQIGIATTTNGLPTGQTIAFPHDVHIVKNGQTTDTFHGNIFGGMALSNSVMTYVGRISCLKLNKDGLLPVYFCLRADRDSLGATLPWKIEITGYAYAKKTLGGD